MVRREDAERSYEVRLALLETVVFGLLGELFRDIPHQEQEFGNVRITRDLSYLLDSQQKRSKLEIYEYLDNRQLNQSKNLPKNVPTSRLSKLEYITSKLQDSYAVLNGSVKKLAKKLELQRDDAQSLKTRTLENLVILSSSMALANEKFRRVIPITIYLDTFDSQAASDVEKALREVTTAAGLEPYDEELPVHGSWFKRIFIRTREIATLPEVQDRLEKIERAVEIAKIESPQAKVDADLSRAVVNLEKALSKHDSGIISVGSLFLVKTTIKGKSNLTVMNLTYEQMDFVKSNPAICSDPKKFLRAFKKAGHAAKCYSEAADYKPVGWHEAHGKGPPALTTPILEPDT